MYILFQISKLHNSLSCLIQHNETSTPSTQVTQDFAQCGSVFWIMMVIFMGKSTSQGLNRKTW